MVKTKVLNIQTRLVKSVIPAEIETAIDNLIEKNVYSKIINSEIDMKELIENVKNFLSPSIDLSEFTNGYFTDGISAGLREVYLNCLEEGKTPIFFSGEYPYLVHSYKKYKIINDLTEVTDSKGSFIFFSNPFSATGNFDPRWNKILDSEIETGLDLAYLDTCVPRKVSISKNVNFVFWSFSKGWGLSHLRIGFLFSRKVLPAFSQIAQVGYCNRVNYAIASELIKSFELGQFVPRYKSKSDLLCREFNLDPSDSFLVATSKSEDYAHLKRSDGTNRIGIGNYL